MAEELEKLLYYIIDHPITQVESREAQLDAPATQDVRAEIAAQVKAQREHAGRLAPYFAQGLRRAARGPLVVDDTNPEDNLVADALARFLVIPDLATSQSTALSESSYRYTFEVNWPLLRQIAQRAGIDLDAALRQPADTIDHSSI